MFSPFIDWLSIKQQHVPGSIPDFGSGVVLKVDSDGLPEWESVAAVQHEGSFSTSVRIRSHGGLVEFSGNPSRFGREDNLFGFTTVFDALHSMVNPLLVSLGLPSFSSGTLFGQRSQVSDELTVLDGAILTRVDLTVNFSFGADRAAALRFMESIVIRGKPSTRYSDGSFGWGSKRFRRWKIYCKYSEMLKHKKKDSSTYFLDLLQWVNEAGLVRFEIELHRDYLREHGLRTLFGWSARSELVIDMFNDSVKKLFPSMGLGGLQDTASVLVDAGIKPLRANRLQGLAYQWAAGVDVFSQLGKSQAYAARSDLLLAGIDIRLPPSNLEQINSRVRVLDLVPAVAPSWYRHAA